jgi:RNA polymerase-binding transcription factor DksA
LNLKGMLPPETLARLKARLETERQELESSLSKFATKDPKVSGDWDTRFPQFEAGVPHPEESASEVEEYEILLGVEHNLELQLKAVNEALSKMQTGSYGICVKCGSTIPAERLEANPSATACAEHS